MGNSTSTPIVLDDGTRIGSKSEASQAFAQAIHRMHCIFKDCDDEFRELSEAANDHGKQSERFKTAGLRLQTCQQRRIRQFSEIEARCGPAQEAYRLCTQREENKGGLEYQCLPVLHSYLDCAERALKDQTKDADARNKT